MSNVIKFPFERTKRYAEKIKAMETATRWWVVVEGEMSEAERRRELHRAALGYAPPGTSTPEDFLK